jgi:hypothetical protein
LVEVRGTWTGGGSSTTKQITAMKKSDEGEEF